jgi:hypothetical protein
VRNETAKIIKSNNLNNTNKPASVRTASTILARRNKDQPVNSVYVEMLREENALGGGCEGA